MKTNTIIAIVLIAIGVVSFAYSYKTKEKIVDIGPVEVPSEKTKALPLPPIVGAIALVGGIVLLITDRKKG